MKWFTCTPVSFGGGADFFARDSGLLSRGFLEIGIESKAVMPGDARPDDEAGLLRVTDIELRDPSWWAAHQLDGVVFYAWGHPRYSAVARAIRSAGVKLVLNQDSSGLVSPLSGSLPWLREQWVLAGGGSAKWTGSLRFVSRVIKGLSYGLLAVDPRRAGHLSQGTLISAVSPSATRYYRILCQRYGGPSLSSRVAFIPHPVSAGFRYSGTSKEIRVLSVGRWDDLIQKRPDRLARVIELVLRQHPSVKFEIVGEPGPVLQRWRRSLTGAEHGRVTFHGKVKSETLARLMQHCAVSYCPSAYESFHIASGEALCCGASVVGQSSASLPAMEWFVSEESGRLARSGDPQSHAEAILRELESWQQGERDPTAISWHWAKLLHAPNVARRILESTTAMP